MSSPQPASARPVLSRLKNNGLMEVAMTKTLALFVLEVEPDLQEVDAQHLLETEWRPPVPGLR